MSVIAGYTPLGSTDVDYIVTVKGAPEIVKDMVGVGLIFLLNVVILIQTAYGTRWHCHFFKTSIYASFLIALFFVRQLHFWG